MDPSTCTTLLYLAVAPFVTRKATVTLWPVVMAVFIVVPADHVMFVVQLAEALDV